MRTDAIARFWLSLPASVGARTLVRAQLALVIEATEALDRQDPETLHDFRVALRRLRSLLRAYRGPLGKAASKRMRRTLRSVARATGERRDADVHGAWLTAQYDRVGHAERHGTQWASTVLTRGRDHGDARIVRAITQELRDALILLRRRLDTDDADHRRHAQKGETLADATSAVVQIMARDLVDALATIGSVTDRTEAHAARIAGKRLRYTLDPFANEETLSGAATLTRRLKQLQDLLGELHDAHVLETRLTETLPESAEVALHHVMTAIRETSVTDTAGFRRGIALARAHDPTPGVLSALGLARERQVAAFAKLSAEWLTPEAAHMIDSAAAEITTALSKS